MPERTDFTSCAEAVLDTAQQLGAEYADIRVEDDRTQRIEVRNGVVAALFDGASRGYGVRVLIDGAWGFASGSSFERLAYDEVAAGAVSNARANAAVARARLGLKPEGVYVEDYATPFAVDPRDISVGERVSFLLDVERLLRDDKRVSVGRAWIDVWEAEKLFRSTSGSKIFQSLRQIGSGMQAMAEGGGDVQARSFPGDAGLYGTGGWELVQAASLAENAQRIGDEAVALLSAPQCPTGTLDVILGGSQVSLQVHESCGHPAELDRVMGWEANFSGTSFLEINELGRLQYGSPIVNIEIDNTLPRGFATCAFDDEGTKSVRSKIISDGVLVGYEMSNDTAVAIGRSSNACARAQSWEYVPMIRMCNLVLQPGNTSFDELFEGVREGIYMESNRSWSIDDRRLNFQFGCQIGWEVKNGKRGRMVKNPTYSGMTTEFWRSCDAIADERSWVAWGTPNCGKGEPMQTGRTTQGASPARFRNTLVGAGYGG